MHTAIKIFKFEIRDKVICFLSLEQFIRLCLYDSETKAQWLYCIAGTVITSVNRMYIFSKYTHYAKKL